MAVDRGEMLLEAIYDDVDRELNPNNDDCWHCGGEGETHDCIDGCCAEADYGCELCSRPCIECRIHEANRARAVRKQVIASGDTDIAIAWLKSIGRWRDDIPIERVQAELVKAAGIKTEADRG